jgi:ceramide glucosyltransferase
MFLMGAAFIVVPLMTLLFGSVVYCALAIAGSLRYRQSGARRLFNSPPVSVLRPLAGAEDNTEASLRSIFEQRYAPFEVLLSVHEESDPAAAVARRMMAEYPDTPSQLIVVGPSPFPNAKVWSLRGLITAASNEVILMTDSDIRIEPDGFQTIVAELQNAALVTCPYRAVGGPKFWSRLEALGLNTEFIGGLLTARLLNGMDFAIGCTIATRKTELEAIGGLEKLQRYLAEDFMMGHLMHARGKKVILSRCVIEHFIGNESLLKSWKHRVRWARSTRRSRPIGYFGELFTKTTAIALILWAVAPALWRFALISIVFRICADLVAGIWVVNDPMVEKYWWLLPLEGIASFATWLLGFFGKTILWRDRRLVVARDGSFDV